jgi:DNA-binding CsgD family transcriptional regulator
VSRRPRSFEQQLSSVLDLIHEVPYGDGQWEPALAAMASFARALTADLSFFDPGTRQMTRWHQSGMDLEAVQRYRQDYMTADIVTLHPRFQYAFGIRENRMMADSEVWTPAEQGRMPFFAELLRPLDFADCILGYAQRRDDGSPWIMLALNFSEGPAQAEERRRMQMLMPHIRRACAAEQQLRTVRRERDALGAALDRSDGAVAMLDRAGRVAYANEAAEALFRRQAGLRLAPDRRLVPGGSEARASLAMALHYCADPSTWTPGIGPEPPTQFLAPRPEGRPLVLRLQPLPQELAGAYGAMALLFIADPDSRARDDRAALRAVYGLSEAETRLVHGLLDGETLKEIATRRQVSYETVRAQLRQVFDKTGTRRQADLVRLAGQLK